ncbi:hypothetical protein TWF730_010466 [Orbilia blumenaviensis]|uniref:Uncharacterized protein n=1 Tax=Orbilia blumenaviensis TaxID=1796055 RepID=A0AAV9UPK1_9PEZI
MASAFGPTVSRLSVAARMGIAEVVLVGGVKIPLLNMSLLVAEEKEICGVNRKVGSTT